MNDPGLFVNEFDFEEGANDQRQPSGANGNDPVDDLGIDSAMKLARSRKVAKMDDDRLLNRPSGLPYIMKNHSKLTRALQHQDERFQKKISKHKYSSSQTKRMKLDHSYDEFEKVLHFYQLWCHSIFPKANFKDCIHMLRAFGGGSRGASLRQYRKGLIEKALHDYKIEKGIIVVDNESSENQREHESAMSVVERLNNNVDDDDDLYTTPQNKNDTAPPESDDDWGFMNVKSSGLFVGNDDDEDYDGIDGDDNDGNKDDHKNDTISNNTSAPPAASNDSDDPFSDDDDEIIKAMAQSKTQIASSQANEIPEWDDFEHSAQKPTNTADIDNASDDEAMAALREMEDDF